MNHAATEGTVPVEDDPHRAADAALVELVRAALLRSDPVPPEVVADAAAAYGVRDRAGAEQVALEWDSTDPAGNLGETDRLAVVRTDAPPPRLLVFAATRSLTDGGAPGRVEIHVELTELPANVAMLTQVLGARSPVVVVEHPRGARSVVTEERGERPDGGGDHVGVVAATLPRGAFRLRVTDDDGSVLVTPWTVA